MAPIALSVIALAGGAVAGLTNTPAQAVKDAYNGLQRLTKNRYVRSIAGVDVLETEIASRELQAFANKQPASGSAAGDPEMEGLAPVQLDAVRAYAPENVRTVGIDPKDIEAGSLGLAGITVQDTRPAPGVCTLDYRGTSDFVIQGGHRPNEVPAGSSAPAAAPKVKILFMAINPPDTTRPRLGGEGQAIDKALQPARYRNLFDRNQARAVRVDDGQSLLMHCEPRIGRSSGHGSTAGLIPFQDDAGRAYAVPPQALATAFSILQDDIRCMVLDPCFTLPQVQALAQSTDCVVCISAEIGDVDARALAVALYQGLAYGRSVRTVFELGCNQIEMAGLKDKSVSQLLAARSGPATMSLVAG